MDNLKHKLAGATKEFSEILTHRSQNLKEQSERRSFFENTALKQKLRSKRSQRPHTRWGMSGEDDDGYGEAGGEEKEGLEEGKRNGELQQDQAMQAMEEGDQYYESRVVSSIQCFFFFSPSLVIALIVIFSVFFLFQID